LLIDVSIRPTFFVLTRGVLDEVEIAIHTNIGEPGMRNTFYCLIAFCVIIASNVFAQIPNAGFENWTAGSLTGWASNNAPGAYTTVTSSTTAHSGSYAVRGDVITFTSIIIQPIIQSGANAKGFAYTQRPTAFTGYYEFFPAASSGDKFAINVLLLKGGLSGTTVAIALPQPSTSVSSYTQFTVPLTYLTADTPDTCIIQIQIIGPGTGAQATPHVGSYFLLDDIAFTGATNVASRQASVPTELQLDQNYPNPFNPTTNISFTVRSDGKATLSVFNLLGQQVGTLFDGPVSSGRLYRATFNASDLPSGVYFSRLDFAPSGSTSSNVELMRKMTLLK
jgi:hypothetical protein